MKNFELCLENILKEENDGKFTSAVAIVEYKNMWLLGLSTDSDDRHLKWVHPGGHIKRGESPKNAAVREAREETGVKCKAIGEPFRMPGHKNIAFVHCKVTSKPKLDSNHEFSAIGFFKANELNSLTLYKNVRKLIDRVK